MGGSFAFQKWEKTLGLLDPDPSQELRTCFFANCYEAPAASSKILA